MVVLSVSILSNNFSAGVNINVPKFVKYLSKYCDSGYLDCGNEDLVSFKEYKNFFRVSDYNHFSIKQLPIPFNKPDLIVFQDFYAKETIPVFEDAIKNKIPYTIIPRGALTKEAQNIKKLKKIIGNFLFFRKYVENASFIHFLTENEKLESQKVFKIRDSVVIGNGIEMPDKQYEIKNRKQFKVLFIGRYSNYHKGLDIFFEAINFGKEYFRKHNISFILYGSNSGNDTEILRKYINDNKLSDLIFLNKSIYGKEKEDILLDCDIFIHTSRLEGHPTSVIEAISYGVPVIVTPGTNVLEDVSKNKLGYTCELDAKKICNTIEYSFENKNEFENISKNEIEFAKNNYNWKKLIKDVFNKYKGKIEK